MYAPALLSRDARLPNSDRTPSLWTVLKDVHRDDRGVVSLETVLILAAVAIPVLIIIVKFGWPKVKSFFDRGVQQLENDTDRAIEGV